MDIIDFPGCCTIDIAVGFGQSGTADWAFNDHDILGNPVTPSVKEVEDFLKRSLKEMKEDGHAILIATTNNEQKNANKALRNCGFKRTKWASKRNHPETKVAVWWKAINE